MRILLLFALLTVGPQSLAQYRPGEFGLYVLALTWSPAFCASRPDKNPEQCKSQNGFVLHGLWPQANFGRNPQYCRSEAFDPEATAPINDSLAQHEWEKHGTCSGMGQAAYFKKAADAFNKIQIPKAFQNISVPYLGSSQQIEQFFIDENPGLKPNQIVARIDRDNRFYELLVCLDRKLNFTTCRNIRSEPPPDSVGTILPNVPFAAEPLSLR